ncbi:MULTISPECIES: oligoribonuclease [Rhodoluna]|uniref:oligoribonuclease n=1 Tax=Rhodoluna TaxID=529883 RepID=UPI001106FE5C|nr:MULTISPECIES: oligoribonuclease [Rhodoluna]
MIEISENLVWIDCEMTGLNPESDCLVEVAVVITNSELEILDEGFDVVIKPREDSWANMNDFVRNMHTESGLINEVENGLELADAEHLILEYIKRFVPNAKEAPLAGNTIGTDRMFLNRYMPELDQHLHYRNIDVSSIKELTRRWYPRVYFQMPKKGGGHRALADILESIQELRYYRETVMVPLPGPTSEQAKAAAELVAKN